MSFPETLLISIPQYLQTSILLSRAAVGDLRNSGQYVK